jgi:hypothetical protein
MQVVSYPYLARQTSVIVKVGFCGQNCSFRLTYLAWVALKNLDPTGRTSGVAAAAMQDVYAAVFDRQNELLAGFGFKRDGAVSRFGGDLLHQKRKSPLDKILITA